MRWRGLIVCLVACGSPPPAAATAVINAMPATICQGHETVVDLDSSGTASHLTLVPAPPDLSEYPLAVEWTFPGFTTMQTCASTMTPPCIEGVDRSKEPIEKPGDVSTISIRTPGDRPLHVSLRVTNAKGGVGEALVTVPLTLADENGNCP